LFGLSESLVPGLRQTWVSRKHSDWLLDTAAMSGGGGGGASWHRQLAVVVLAIAISAAWVLVPHPLEGPVLLSLSDSHGVHLTDPLIVIPLGLAWWTVVRD
jgi:hypothetical protein